MGGFATHETGPAFIWHWDGVAALRHRVSRSAVPVLLLEEAGRGAIAVGPLFRRDRAGCLDCYIARRVAAGATELRPLAGLPPWNRLRPAIAAVLAADRAGEVPIQQLVAADGPGSTHRLLPLPGCACHGNGPGPQGLARLPLAGAVDQRLGIIREVSIGHDGRTGYTTARAHGAGYTTPAGDPVFNHGFAADPSADRARVRAIGEALERYAAALGGPSPRLCEPNESVSGPWPEQRLPGAEGLRWMSGRRLADDRSLPVPARRVRLPYRPSPDEPPLAEVTSSTGLAAATELADAEQRGLLELIERDVFMRAWRLVPELERLQPERDDPPGLEVVRLRHAGGIPVVVAFLEDGRPPFSAAGLAARLTVAEARQAALREAVAARIWVEERIGKDPTIPPNPPHTLYDHAKLHALDPGLRAARAGWLARATRCEDGPAVADVATLLAAERGAIAVEMTTPDLALLGCRVVRVVAPGRVSLDSDGRYPCLSGWPMPHPFA
jgi:ribosomal protein S12 methylthiotransferase accessory factor